MSSTQWFNPNQARPLVNLQLLFYIRAIFGGFSLIFAPDPIYFLYLAVTAGAAFGIAQESKLGYYAGLASVAFSVFVVYLQYRAIEAITFEILLSALFTMVGVGLILHQESREYVRTWFK